MTPPHQLETTRNRAVGYIRVSTIEQAASGLGLEAQRAAILDTAQRLGMDVAVVHSDEGTSGSAPLTDRRGLMAALDALRPGDTLLVARLDRLSRGDVLESAVLEQLVSRRRARILSCHGEGTDRDDPTALLTRRMLQLVAGYERSLIAARTKAALAAKRARGERVGALPYGQTDDERQVLALIADARTAGYSYRAIADELNVKGFTTRRGSPWKPQYVASIIQTIAGQRKATATRSRHERATRAALAALK